jgi:hypothetical protein
MLHTRYALCSTQRERYTVDVIATLPGAICRNCSNQGLGTFDNLPCHCPAGAQLKGHAEARWRAIQDGELGGRIDLPEWMTQAFDGGGICSRCGGHEGATMYSTTKYPSVENPSDWRISVEGRYCFRCCTVEDAYQSMVAFELESLPGWHFAALRSNRRNILKGWYVGWPYNNTRLELTLTDKAMETFTSSVGGVAVLLSQPLEAWTELWAKLCRWWHIYRDVPRSALRLEATPPTPPIAALPAESTILDFVKIPQAGPGEES